MPQYGVLDANRIAVKVPGAAQEKCGANEFLARQLPEPFEAPVERQRRVQSDKWPEGSKKGNIRQGGRWRSGISLPDKSDCELCDASDQAMCKWCARNVKGTQTGSSRRICRAPPAIVRKTSQINRPTLAHIWHTKRWRKTNLSSVLEQVSLIDANQRAAFAKLEGLE
jgi:hypothetical protein